MKQWVFDAEESGWKTVIDFTTITEDGIPAEEVLAALKQMSDKTTDTE